MRQALGMEDKDMLRCSMCQCITRQLEKQKYFIDSRHNEPMPKQKQGNASVARVFLTFGALVSNRVLQNALSFY